MLTIERFHSAYHVPHGTPDVDALRARLDRTVRERLPAAVSAHTPAIGGDAYYVIRRLHLNLWVDALAMGDGEVAERWGRLLASAVARAILYGGDDVQRYENVADYIACFLDDIMAGVAWSRWQYRQLSPLEGLPAGAAAAHLLAARPGLLIGVAAQLARRGRLGALLDAMTEADADLVWRDGLGFADTERFLLPEGIEDLAEGVASALPAESGPVPFAKLRLGAYLHLAVATHRDEPSPELAAAAQAAARLHQLVSARPDAAVWRAIAAGEVDGPAAVAPFLAGLGAPDAAKARLVELLAAQGGPPKVAALLRLVLPAAPAMPGPASRARRQVVASASAGLALLLPVVREMGVFEAGGREAVYQLLIDAAGPEHAPMAAGDAGLRVLAGIEPAEAERARFAAVTWPVLEPPAAATVPGYLPITLETLRRFAARLRRFEASSPEYLGRQFLRQPGHLELDGERLTVTLHGAPLGLVLQMSGLTGPQGTLPWLDGRSLDIELPPGSA